MNKTTLFWKCHNYGDNFEDPCPAGAYRMVGHEPLQYSILESQKCCGTYKDPEWHFLTGILQQFFRIQIAYFAVLVYIGYIF